MKTKLIRSHSPSSPRSPSWAGRRIQPPRGARDQQRPAADNTDVYAWVTSGSHDKLYVITNWIPLEEPAGGPTHRFSDDVLYEIHVARGNQSLEDVVTYQFGSGPRHPAGRPGGPRRPPGGGKEFFAQLAGAFDQTYTVTKIVGRGGNRQERVIAGRARAAAHRPANAVGRERPRARALHLARLRRRLRRDVRPRQGRGGARLRRPA